MSRLSELEPRHFGERLLAAGQRRAYVVYEPHQHTYSVSHPVLRELADFLISDRRDCRDHEAIFLEYAPDWGALFGVFLHKTVRGQAQGGLRRQPYERLEDFVRDGLRLSLGMTRKNALAGVWWGGGKGLIAQAADGGARKGEARAAMYRGYGAFVSSLRGSYVTAEDAGTGQPDMAEVHVGTRFSTCIPPAIGGAGNPSRMTAAGVVCAMESALEFDGLGPLEGKTVAMQGTGNVGSAMVPLLLERGVARIVASEIDPSRRDALLDAYSGEPVEVRLERPGEATILGEACDVLAPNALGGILGPKTIPSIQARVVCGSANNQLLDGPRDGRALAERGITYVPDLIANRMGIVFCGNEQYGYVNNDPMVQRHLGRTWHGGIHATIQRVLEMSKASDVTPSEAATSIADELADEPHPIWGHRSRYIIESLIADRWERS